MATVAISSASSLNRPKPFICSSISPASNHHDVVNVLMVKPPSLSLITLAPHRDGRILKAKAAAGHRRRRMTRFEVASRSDFTDLDDPPSSASISEEDEELNRAAAAATATNKIGARVRVKVPLKVFHVPRVPEVDLTGMEGQLKQYVGLWKGKRLSVNLPFRVEFVTVIGGRGPVKFFAHLKEDEFEYLEST